MILYLTFKEEGMILNSTLLFLEPHENCEKIPAFFPTLIIFFLVSMECIQNRSPIIKKRSSNLHSCQILKRLVNLVPRKGNIYREKRDFSGEAKNMAIHHISPLSYRFFTLQLLFQLSSILEECIIYH